MYVFSYFPFGFEGRILDLILSVSDHCLSFYLTIIKFMTKQFGNARTITVNTICVVWRVRSTERTIEQSHETMALFVLPKFIRQPRMRSLPVGLDV